MEKVFYHVISSFAATEDGELLMYGVRGGYAGSDVREFPALFTERETAERFAAVLEEAEVSPCHVMDIIVDGFTCAI